MSEPEHARRLVQPDSRWGRHPHGRVWTSPLEPFAGGAGQSGFGDGGYGQFSGHGHGAFGQGAWGGGLLGRQDSLYWSTPTPDEPSGRGAGPYGSGWGPRSAPRRG